MLGKALIALGFSKQKPIFVPLLICGPRFPTPDLRFRFQVRFFAEIQKFKTKNHDLVIQKLKGQKKGRKKRPQKICLSRVFLPLSFFGTMKSVLDKIKRKSKLTASRTFFKPQGPIKTRKRCFEKQRCQRRLLQKPKLLFRLNRCSGGQFLVRNCLGRISRCRIRV